jgi:hypothetical protein
VAGTRAVLRVSLADRLALRARIAWTWREAEDPIHSSEGWRTGLGAEVRLEEASYLRAGLAFARADEVFYLPSDDMMAGRTSRLRTGRFGPPGGFSQPVEPVKAPADTWVASAGIEIGLGGGAYLDAEISRSWVEADLASYQADSAAVSLGVRR